MFIVRCFVKVVSQGTNQGGSCQGTNKGGSNYRSQTKHSAFSWFCSDVVREVARQGQESGK